MSFNESLLAVENKVIDLLTAVTWWIEVRFERNNLHLATFLSALSSLFFTLAFSSELPSFIEKRQWGGTLIFTFIASVSFLFFLGRVFLESIVFEIFQREYPQGTPNPCRISEAHSRKRRIETTLVMVCYFTLAKDIFLICLFLGYLASLITLFVLACDSIPPSEKSRRKKLAGILSYDTARLNA